MRHLAPKLLALLPKADAPFASKKSHPLIWLLSAQWNLLRPYWAWALSWNIFGNWWLLLGLDVEDHDLPSRDVLFHVAMECPRSWIIGLETDDGPTATPKADHVLLKRILEILRCRIPFRVIGAAPIRIIRKLGARISCAGIFACGVFGDFNGQEEAFEMRIATPLL